MLKVIIYGYFRENDIGLKYFKNKFGKVWQRYIIELTITEFDILPRLKFVGFLDYLNDRNHIH